MTVEVRSQGGQWTVMVNGSTHSTHRLKSAAEDEAQRVARKRGGNLRVQKRDGQFQYNRSY
ncbi:DUF2188 domain-containing protein [Natronorubrum halophilum]|uniref:DUF2188 domain-containing protein n=1 Tax=Natronorubrum halophilum TaxID=1702106 RepID=UPI000EF6E137|nr:DUF2188 domain-containing protein [Natronorubrum halophilum]